MNEWILFSRLLNGSNNLREGVRRPLYANETLAFGASGYLPGLAAIEAVGHAALIILHEYIDTSQLGIPEKFAFFESKGHCRCDA